MRIAELAGRRVAVWGYGHEGRAALHALRAYLPALPLTLFCSAAEAPTAMRDLVSALKDGVASSLDEAAARISIETAAPDAAALSAFDVVIKSPGISAYRAEILEARHNGTRFTSGTALWFAEHAEARVIAVTGTKGKSTVSALIAHLLRALGRRVALAGNIGLPLLDLLDAPARPDWWVIELSSFQTREAGPVAVGVINNVYEEHLDWHGTRERYVEDKLALAAVAATLVVNADARAFAAPLPAHAQRIAFGGADGWHVDGDAIAYASHRVFDLVQSPLRGAHNALNLCAALAAVDAAGEDAGAAARAIATFAPLPHRLQRLGDRDRLEWIDDSIATTPQATLEALASVARERTTLLVGGYERGLDWSGFADAVRERPPHAIIATGANGPRIAALLAASGGAYRLESAPTLVAAVDLARILTPAGGTVLLSPGAPSFDAFKDYAERGRAFAERAGFAPGSDRIDGLGIA